VKSRYRQQYSERLHEQEPAADRKSRVMHRRGLSNPDKSRAAACLRTNVESCTAPVRLPRPIPTNSAGPLQVAAD
jgi:hypothetical protein